MFTGVRWSAATYKADWIDFLVHFASGETSRRSPGRNRLLTLDKWILGDAGVRSGEHSSTPSCGVNGVGPWHAVSNVSHQGIPWLSTQSKRTLYR